MIVISKTLGASLCFLCLLLVNWNYHSWKKKKERGELAARGTKSFNLELYKFNSTYQKIT
jgi:hypothetical protein